MVDEFLHSSGIQHGGSVNDPRGMWRGVLLSKSIMRSQAWFLP